jgi:hypothetical protein
MMVYQVAVINIFFKFHEKLFQSEIDALFYTRNKTRQKQHLASHMPKKRCNYFLISHAMRNPNSSYEGEHPIQTNYASLFAGPRDALGHIPLCGIRDPRPLLAAHTPQESTPNRCKIFPPEGRGLEKCSRDFLQPLERGGSIRSHSTPAALNRAPQPKRRTGIGSRSCTFNVSKGSTNPLVTCFFPVGVEGVPNIPSSRVSRLHFIFSAREEPPTHLPPSPPALAPAVVAEHPV